MRGRCRLCRALHYVVHDEVLYHEVYPYCSSDCITCFIPFVEYLVFDHWIMFCILFLCTIQCNRIQIKEEYYNGAINPAELRSVVYHNNYCTPKNISVGQPSPHHHHHTTITTPPSPHHHHHTTITTPPSPHHHHHTTTTTPPSLEIHHHHHTTITRNTPPSPSPQSLKTYHYHHYITQQT